VIIGRRKIELAALMFGVLVAGVAFAAEAGGPAEARFLDNPRQVTSGFVKAGEGYFSPDGTEIIYQAITREYPFYQIYRQALDGGHPRLVSTSRGRTTCSYFHPSGTKVIFASSHLDPNLEQTEKAAREKQAADKKSGRHRHYEWVFDPYMDIFEKDLATGRLRRLTDAPGYDAECAYSKDGQKIAFCSTRDGDPDLYIMDADGSHVRQLTNQPGYDGGPFISPDGRWVVYRTDRKKKDYLQIHVISIDGKTDVTLTNTNGVNWAPYWHPTKPYLIWAGADHSKPGRPNYDLWLMRYEIDGNQFIPGEVKRVTDHPAADVLPVFSPDGHKLMWTSTRTADGSSQLWIAGFHLPK